MTLKSVLKVVCYGISSSALLVLNKISITAVPNASFLLFIQILSTTVFIIFPTLSGHVKVNLRPSREILRAYVFVAVVFLSTIYSNFQVLHAIGVNSFIVLRCATPLMISFLDWVFLNRQLPTGKSLGSLVGIFLVGSMYANLKYRELSGEHQSSPVGFRGIAWSLVWLACFMLDMIYIKHVADAYECTGLERTLYQNTLTLPVLVVLLCSPLESIITVKHGEVEARALVAIVLSCIAGAILSYTGMSLRTDLSATSFTVLGILCKMASALLNEVFVSPEPNRLSLLCLIGVVVISSFFRQADLRDENDEGKIQQNNTWRHLARSLPIVILPAFFVIGLLVSTKHFTSVGGGAIVRNILEDIELGASASRGKNVPSNANDAGDTITILNYKRIWGVTTTILEVNLAIEHFVTTFDANLVVVGDRQTNHSEWSEFESLHNNVIYLSPEEQDELNFEVLRHIPWNHFGRKNLGFLVAIKNGAEIIYDFDDDNHLTISSFDELTSMDTHCLQTEHHVFNPYPYFGPEHKGNESMVWPRGFPLSFINDFESQNAPADKCLLKDDRLAVFQSLANHDPDVDAIYRLTRPLPISFTKQNTLFVPPRGTYIPWNAQATVLNKAAFFGLLLPVTVTGRVTDIWRSYITTRLLWEANYHVGFSSPVSVSQSTLLYARFGRRERLVL